MIPLWLALDPAAPAQLLCAVETDLSEPVYVGAGIAYPLQGWCYSPSALVRKLEILANAGKGPLQ